MRMKSIILIFIAIACGLVASIGISQVMERGGGQIAQLETEQILVSLKDMDINDKLDAGSVQLEEWPKAKIPEGAIRTFEEVKDKYALYRFIKGEPILLAKVTDTPGNITVQIPEGYRAIPVKVEEDTVMKAITPGDRVDVLVFLRKGEEIPRTGVFTILQNVRVFAVNTSTERVLEKGAEVNFRTVSLLLKPAHSQELALAAQMGKILLTLRRPDEKDVLGGEKVTPIGDILDGKADKGSEGSATPSSPLIDILPNLPVADPHVPADSVISPLPALPPEFEMLIYDRDNVKKYEWQKRDGLPVESTVSSGPAASGPVLPATPTTPQPAPSTDNPPAPEAPQG